MQSSNKENFAYNQMNQQPTNNKFSMSRSRMNTCRIVLLTSLFWVFVDAFLIFYLSDCSTYCIQQQQIYEQQYKLKHSAALQAEQQVDVDYDQNLKLKNQRLHDVHKIKKEKKNSIPRT